MENIANANETRALNLLDQAGFLRALRVLVGAAAAAAAAAVPHASDSGENFVFVGSLTTKRQTKSHIF